MICFIIIQQRRCKERMPQELTGEKTNIKKSKFEMDMCSGSILKKMLLFSIPLILSSVLQLLFNTADVIVVGKYAGRDSLSAVGSTGSLINLFVNLFMGLSVGTNVVVARLFSAKKNQDVTEAVHSSITISLIGGVILTIIGIFLAPQLLKLMNTPDSLLDLASLYVRIYFVGITASLIYNFGSAILRAIGDTRRPLIFLIIAGIVNVVLNLFFVIVLKLDVAGVALATTISQCLSAFLVIRCLIKEQSAVHLSLKELRIYKDKLISILKIGIPAGVQGSLFALSNVAIQSAINSFGDIVMAGNAAAANLEGYVYVSMNAIHQATISFIGQNVGGKKYERINKIIFTAIGCVTVVGLVLGLSMYIGGNIFLYFYTDDAAVVSAGMIRLKYVSTVYFLCGIMDVLVGALRGLGRSIMPMIVSLMGACVFRLVWIFTIFKIERFHIIETVYISYAISWILTAAVHATCLYVIRRTMKKHWGV